jgi:2-oxoglutarate dehydrogenase E2 component (dihydrolipoamide succinyltransferase)
MNETTILKLPQMGEGVHEATIIKWFKNPGDKIVKDEPILEIATDKVDTEIVAPVSGYLIVTFAKPGDVVLVQQELAQISLKADAKLVVLEKKSDAKTDRVPEKVSSSKSSQTSTITKQRTQQIVSGHFAGPVRSSPLVRKLARENGIELSELSGSGLHGRITKDDLFSTASVGSSETGLDLSESLFSQKTELRDGKEYLDGVEVQRSKMSRIRKLTAEHMLRSVRVSPHVTTTFEIDFTSVVQKKKNLEDEFFSKYKSKLSFTAFFIHASIQALKEHPTVNASVDGDDILLKERINIACAVATDQGLIVPVLKDLNSCDLFETARRLNDLVKRAREKRLNPEEVQGGTFSITNPGIYGSLHSQPIINQPQVAILSTGAIVERPHVVKGKIQICPLVQVGLTFDHRVVDGEGGAKFLRTLKLLLES